MSILDKPPVITHCKSFQERYRSYIYWVSSCPKYSNAVSTLAFHRRAFIMPSVSLFIYNGVSLLSIHVSTFQTTSDIFSTPESMTLSTLTRWTLFLIIQIVVHILEVVRIKSCPIPICAQVYPVCAVVIVRLGLDNAVLNINVEPNEPVNTMWVPCSCIVDRYLCIKRNLVAKSNMSLQSYYAINIRVLKSGPDYG